MPIFRLIALVEETGLLKRETDQNHLRCQLKRKTEVLSLHQTPKQFANVTQSTYPIYKSGHLIILQSRSHIRMEQTATATPALRSHSFSSLGTFHQLLQETMSYGDGHRLNDRKGSTRESGNVKGVKGKFLSPQVMNPWSGRDSVRHQPKKGKMKTT